MDNVYILFSFFLFLISVRKLSWFKLSQHAPNLGIREGDKQENRIMIMGWE